VGVHDTSFQIIEIKSDGNWSLKVFPITVFQPISVRYDSFHYYLEQPHPIFQFTKGGKKKFQNISISGLPGS
jgi:hypothetical protein